MSKVAFEEIEKVYEEFKKKYDSDEYKYYGILNQYKILKDGIKGLYEDKNSSTVFYIKEFDKYVSEIKNGLGTPSEAENVHEAIRKLNKLLKRYLSDLEKSIEKQIYELEANEDVDKEKLNVLKERFKSRNFGKIEDKINILNECINLSKDIGIKKIETQLEIAQYGSEYIHENRKNESRENLIKSWTDMVVYDTVLETALESENAEDILKNDLYESLEWQRDYLNSTYIQTGKRYEDDLVQASSDGIVDNIHYFQVINDSLIQNNEDIIKSSSELQKVVSQISNCDTRINTLELYDKHNTSKDSLEELKEQLKKLEEERQKLSEKYTKLSDEIDRLQNVVQEKVNEFNATINVNRNESQSNELIVTDEKPSVLKKISGFFSEKVAGITGKAKKVKERFDAEKEVKSTLIKEKIREIEKSTGKKYSKLDVNNLKQRLGGIFGASLMMLNSSAAFSKEHNLEEIFSENITKVEDADYSSYYTRDNSIQEYLENFYSNDTAIGKKYRAIVSEMDYTPAVKEMFAYNIQAYIENYEQNAEAWGFDVPLETMLDQIIVSADDIGNGIVIEPYIMAGAIAYTEGTGLDDSQKKVALSKDNGYHALFHEIEHTDQGMTKEFASEEVFDELMCPNKFYHFLLEGDAQFVQLLGSDEIVDFGISFSYADVWAQYNMLMQSVGSDELHEYVQNGCKEEKFVDFVKRRFEEQNLSSDLAEEFIIDLQNSLLDKFNYIYNEIEPNMSISTAFSEKAKRSYNTYRMQSEQTRFNKVQETTLKVLKEKIKNADTIEKLEETIQDVASFKLFSADNGIEISRTNFIKNINYEHFNDAEETIQNAGLYDSIYQQYINLYDSVSLTEEEFYECFDSVWECADINQTIENANITASEEEIIEDNEEIIEDQEEITEDQEEITEDQEEITEDQEEITEDQEEITEDQEEITEDQEEITIDNGKIIKNTQNSIKDIKKLIDEAKRKEEEHKKMMQEQSKKEAEEQAAYKKYGLNDDFKNSLREMTENETKVQNQTKNVFTIEQIKEMKQILIELYKNGKISMGDLSQAAYQINEGKVPDVIKNKDSKEIE